MNNAFQDVPGDDRRYAAARAHSDVTNLGTLQGGAEEQDEEEEEEMFMTPPETLPGYAFTVVKLSFGFISLELAVQFVISVLLKLLFNAKSGMQVMRNTGLYKLIICLFVL